MTRIFAPGPHRGLPDPTAALRQLEQLLAEAGELRARIASACTGTSACVTPWPARRRLAASNVHLVHARTQNGG